MANQQIGFDVVGTSNAAEVMGKAGKEADKLANKLKNAFDVKRTFTNAFIGAFGLTALLSTGIGYVTDKLAEYQQAQKDAFDAGAKPVYDELKAQEALGVQLDKNLSAVLAMAKIKQERAKNIEDVRLQENLAIEAFLNTEAGMKFKQQHTVQSTDESYYVALREQELAAAKAAGAVINTEKEKNKNNTFNGSLSGSLGNAPTSGVIGVGNNAQFTLMESQLATLEQIRDAIDRLGTPQGMNTDFTKPEYPTV